MAKKSVLRTFTCDFYLFKNVYFKWLLDKGKKAQPEFYIKKSLKFILKVSLQKNKCRRGCKKQRYVLPKKNLFNHVIKSESFLELRTSSLDVFIFFLDG